MKKPERIDPHYTSPGTKRLQKKVAHRAMRRAAKNDPENAPKRYEFHGWMS